MKHGTNGMRAADSVSSGEGIMDGWRMSFLVLLYLISRSGRRSFPSRPFSCVSISPSCT